MRTALNLAGIAALTAAAYKLGDRNGYTDGVTDGATKAFLVMVKKRKREDAAKRAQETEGEAYTNA